MAVEDSGRPPPAGEAPGFRVDRSRGDEAGPRLRRIHPREPGGHPRGERRDPAFLLAGMPRKIPPFRTLNAANPPPPPVDTDGIMRVKIEEKRMSKEIRET